MPYRVPALPLPVAALMPCVRCASPVGAPVPAVDPVVRCEPCGTRQPLVATTRDLVPDELRFVSLASAGYEELAAFAIEIGARAPAKASLVTLRCDGMKMEASLSINSGTVMGLDLVAHTAGLPAMRLVREGRRQRDAKASGLSREIQVGDAAFDDAVYIETDAAADAVLHVLGPPVVRAAVQRLLGIADAVTLDAKTVRIYARKAAGPFAPATLRSLVSELRAVAGAPRLVAITYEAEPRAAVWVKRATYLSAAAGVGALVVGLGWYAPDDVSAALLVPSLVAFFVALAVAPLLGRLLRGRSTSHRDLLAVRIVLALGLPMLASGGAAIANAALDTSPERAEQWQVVSSSEDDENHGKQNVRSKNAQGAHRTDTFETGAVDPSYRVVVRWRRGAFGWRWESNPVVLLR